MKRRRLLGLCGTALAGAAGCLSGRFAGVDRPNGSTGDPTPDGTGTTPGKQPTSTSETTRSTADPGNTADGVSVSKVVVRKAVRYESIMGSGGVLAGEDRQYVVATVRTDRDLSTTDFTFETDDGSWDAGLPETAGATNYSVAGHGDGPVGESQTADGGPAYLAVTVPSPLSATNPRIRLADDADATWLLSETNRERLAAPAPRFELQSLDVPDEIRQGRTLSVSLTAKNVSETDGRFLAAVYWPTALIADDDEAHIVQRQVGAGETATASLDLSTEYTAAEDGPVTLRVAGHVTAEREVRMTDVTTQTWRTNDVIRRTGHPAAGRTCSRATVPRRTRMGTNSTPATTNGDQ